MFLKSKGKLVAFVFASFLVHTACTKDEESMKAPVKAETTGDQANSQTSADMANDYRPVYFDFDSSSIKDTEQEKIMHVSEKLKTNNANVEVEGHCDERGTTEYNLALGTRRATEVKNTLVQMGVTESKISTISYGKERPVDDGHNEAAWSKNRRAEFRLGQ